MRTLLGASVLLAALVAYILSAQTAPARPGGAADTLRELSAQGPPPAPGAIPLETVFRAIARSTPREFLSGDGPASSYAATIELQRQTQELAGKSPTEAIQIITDKLRNLESIRDKPEIRSALLEQAVEFISEAPENQAALHDLAVAELTDPRNKPMDGEGSWEQRKLLGTLHYALILTTQDPAEALKLTVDAMRANRSEMMATELARRLTARYPELRPKVAEAISSFSIKIQPETDTPPPGSPPPRRTPSMTSKHSRKILLINPRFQFSFVGYMLGVSTLTILIFYCAQAYFFMRLFEKGQELKLPIDHPFFQFVAQQQSVMRLIFALAALVALAFLMVTGLYISHRVAGPLHRLRTYLDQNAETPAPPELAFRAKDYFPEVAASFNRFMGARRRRGLPENQ